MKNHNKNKHTNKEEETPGLAIPCEINSKINQNLLEVKRKSDSSSFSGGLKFKVIGY